MRPRNKCAIARNKMPELESDGRRQLHNGIEAAETKIPKVESDIKDLGVKSLAG